MRRPAGRGASGGTARAPDASRKAGAPRAASPAPPCCERAAACCALAATCVGTWVRRVICSANSDNEATERSNDAGSSNSGGNCSLLRSLTVPADTHSPLSTTTGASERTLLSPSDARLSSAPVSFESRRASRSMPPRRPVQPASHATASNEMANSTRISPLLARRRATRDCLDRESPGSASTYGRGSRRAPAAHPRTSRAASPAHRC